VLRTMIVAGFGGARVRHVCAGACVAFAIGEGGELFSWGVGDDGVLGHGDTQNQPLPKRVEALRGVRVSSASIGNLHALALAEDGLVYAWRGPSWATRKWRGSCCRSRWRRSEAGA
jgi:alpha-tubulin suppressor-like RCC1 family protein